MQLRILFVLILHLYVSTISAQGRLTRKDATAYAAKAYLEMKNKERNDAEKEWSNAQIELDSFTMRFKYRIYGNAPADGRSLYISMHGGGGVPAKVNDEQWNNQIGLYKPEEGVYVAPRATTNTWMLWHEANIDDMFDRLILDAVITQGVNPDKVYLLGYSAGGDGAFQLAPRMADRFAAASMMAGHPGDARPYNLRNLPFSMFIGEFDAAYNRNKLVPEYSALLDSIRNTDTAGYIHQLHVYPTGHWMDRKDTIAVPWMAQYKRNPAPDKVYWRQDDRTHNFFYWLEIPAGSAEGGKEAIASIKNNTITLLKNDYDTLYINLNDTLLDLDKKVVVKYQNKVIFNDYVRRDKTLIDQSITNRKDAGYIFAARLCVSGTSVTRWK
ncbi:alpha/beta hydrolase [Chitinophaga silvatica]|uniref:Alpha/beta hydrolase n=1 Tax=Chitinophaga silvatica TaxID=2282649 RepID=A0A3E1YH54_9BACT|nr:alpha/beta hydrolase [Chitinophaga silvatica]RFS26702.1 alpha/beta hydrolase [Chitinophaga silvatica]